MIYKIIPVTDKFLEKIHKDSLEELNAFYEINWVYNLPKIMVVKDRKTINLLRGAKTENWLIGWSDNKVVYVLNGRNFKRESSHKYDSKEYRRLIKHELSHLFFNVLSNGCHKPIWLNEGLAIYTSGQAEFRKKTVKFKKFLEFYDNGGREVYDEAGFFIQFLIEKFGKKKLLGLIKNLSKSETKKQFEKLFSKTYGFNLRYKEINSFLSRTAN